MKYFKILIIVFSLFIYSCGEEQNIDSKGCLIYPLIIEYPIIIDEEKAKENIEEKKWWWMLIL